MVGPHGYAWLWREGGHRQPNGGETSGTSGGDGTSGDGMGGNGALDTTVGQKLLEFAAVTLELNIQNVTAFHRAPDFLTAIATDTKSSSGKKTMAVVAVVDAITAQLRSNPEIAMDMALNGVDLIGWSIRANPSAEVDAIIRGVQVGRSVKSKAKSLVVAVKKLAVKSSGGASSLLLCKTAWGTTRECSWICGSAPTIEGFDALFVAAVRRGKRAEIRNLHALCRSTLLEAAPFRFVFEWLSEAKSRASSSPWQLAALEAILRSAQRLDTPAATDQTRATVARALGVLEDGLRGFIGDLNRHTFDEIKTQLGCASLLQTVGIADLRGLPAEVAGDDTVFRLFVSVASRLDKIDTTRFEKLKEALVLTVRQYLLLELAADAGADADADAADGDRRAGAGAAAASSGADPLDAGRRANVAGDTDEGAVHDDALHMLVASLSSDDEDEVAETETISRGGNSGGGGVVAADVAAAAAAASSKGSSEGSCDSAGTEVAAGIAAGRLAAREAAFETWISELDFNVTERAALKAAGYADAFWGEELSATAVTESRCSEEAHKVSLCGVFRQYAALLQRVGIAKLKVSRARTLDVDDQLFSELLSMEDLRSRRAAAVRALNGAGQQAEFAAVLDTVLELLVKEEGTDERMQAHKSGAPKQIVLTATLHHRFITCAATCTESISGCYAPNGDHCQKPLEVGLRCNMAFVSIRDDEQVEVESAELLLTDQGILVYRAYTSGHTQDTAPLYAALFHKYLAAKLVPGFILPANHPKPSVFYALQTAVADDAAAVGFTISCRFDLEHSGERSYFDSRPTLCRSGVDLMLSSMPVASADGAHVAGAGEVGANVDGDGDRGGNGGGVHAAPGATEGQRQAWLVASRKNASLDGIFAKLAIAAVLADAELKRLAFLGKQIGAAVGGLLRDATPMDVALGQAFDYSKWRQNPRNAGCLLESTKGELVRRLVDVAETAIWSWIDTELEHPAQLLVEFPRPVFLDLLAFLCSQQHLIRSAGQPLPNTTTTDSAAPASAPPLLGHRRTQATVEAHVAAMRQALQDSVELTMIGTLQPKIQRSVMRWIFRNEDRVWRSRGGRGDESVHTFLGLLRLEPPRAAGHNMPELLMSSKDADAAAAHELARAASGPAAEGDIPHTAGGGGGGGSRGGGSVAAGASAAIAVSAAASAVVGSGRRAPTGVDREADSERGGTSSTVGPAFPGVLVLASLGAVHRMGDDGAVVGYAVGECVAMSLGDREGELVCYEIMTAYVDPRHRGIGVAARLYQQAIEQAPRCCDAVALDVLSGSFDRIARFMPGGTLVTWLGLIERLVVLERRNSYTVRTETGVEQFERVVFWRRPAVAIIKAARAANSVQRFCAVHRGAVEVGAVSAALGTAAWYYFAK
jgi:GNAT superfamily N-acetyltransferase